MKFSIDSDRLRIRQFEPGDTEDFVSFMTDPESTQFLVFDETQKSREGASDLLLRTIDSYASASPLMAFAVEDRVSANFVGFCGLTPREIGAVEIMYAIMPEERGNGYAVETASRLAQYAIHELGYSRVIAPISPDHEVSKAVAAKAGFNDQGLRDSADTSGRICLYVYEQGGG